MWIMNTDELQGFFKKFIIYVTVTVRLQYTKICDKMDFKNAQRWTTQADMIVQQYNNNGGNEFLDHVRR